MESVLTVFHGLFPHTVLPQGPSPVLIPGTPVLTLGTPVLTLGTPVLTLGTPALHTVIRPLVS